MGALAGRLPAEQAAAAARDALRPVLRAMRDSSDLGDLAETAAALAGRLPAEQAAAAARDALRPVLEAVRGTTALSARKVLAEAAGALVGRLPAEHAAAAAQILHTARAALGWSASPEEAAAWARVLVSLLALGPEEEQVRGIVEALKYPTTAGPATEVLLDALRDRSRAPGAEAGLEANLRWVSARFPAVDLSSPPVCPEPQRPDLACPDPAGISAGRGWNWFPWAGATSLSPAAR